MDSFCEWKWFQKWWLLFSTFSIDDLWGVTETFLIITQSSGGLKRAEQQGLWLRENHLAFPYLYIPLKMRIEWVLSFSEPWGVRLFIFNDKHSMLMSPQCHDYWLPTHLVAAYWLFEKHAFPLPCTTKTYMCILPKTECSIHKSRSRSLSHIDKQYICINMQEHALWFAFGRKLFIIGACYMINTLSLMSLHAFNLHVATRLWPRVPTASLFCIHFPSEHN